MSRPGHGGGKARHGEPRRPLAPIVTVRIAGPGPLAVRVLHGVDSHRICEMVERATGRRTRDYYPLYGRPQDVVCTVSTKSADLSRWANLPSQGQRNEEPAVLTPGPLERDPPPPDDGDDSKAEDTP